ncbi:MAG TPA: response regulator [Polyangiaceae bacterium]|nr:response regulator [Polyangiaceae bacterium]
MDYILVVEDDEGVRQGIAEIIESEGFCVVSCDDGLDAIRQLAERGDVPRVILLDFAMPHMDGWAFLDARQKDERLRGVPVLGMSASQKLIDQKIPPSGVDDFLKKPFKVEHMLDSIHKHWG